VAKVAFLQNIWFEWLGVMYLSAVLKKRGHDTDIFIGGREKILCDLKSYDPDVIAVSLMGIQNEWLKDVAVALRSSGFKQPIIVGGPEASYSPEEVIEMEGVSAICVGEGEDAMEEFVEAVVKKKKWNGIANLWIKKTNNDGTNEIIKNEVRNLENDLDLIPSPDRDLYRKEAYFAGEKPYELFEASRGCPFDCSFCFIHQFRDLYRRKGKGLRLHTPQLMVDEIKEAHKKYGIQQVMFVDSTFNLNRKWTIEFCNLFAEQTDLKMTVNIRADVMDEEVMQALSRARCEPARFAIETGSEQMRNGILEKKLTDEQILTTVKLFKKYNVPFLTFNMMGMPNETLDMAWSTIKMNQELNPNQATMALFMPYPNLNLTKYALNEGILDEASLKKLGEGGHKMFRSVLKQKEIKEVSNLQKFALLVIRFPKLKPIVKRLIKLPENMIFDGISGLASVFEFLRWTKSSRTRMLLDILKNFKQLVLKNP
jgi:anaerobic magnesium-protoporphyrin IX monomethyl ester cyclase